MEETVKFECEGHEFEASKTAIKSYRVQKQLARAKADPNGMMDAVERIFMGRDVEYVDALGGDAEKLEVLLSAAIAAANAKN